MTTETKPLTNKEARVKLRALGDLPIATKRSVLCQLVGHSNVLSGCFGYISCVRCSDQIGDTLAGCYTNKDAVIVGHGCKDCRANRKRLTWRDLLLLPSVKLP